MTKIKTAFFVSAALFAVAVLSAASLVTYVKWQQRGMRPGSSRLAELQQRERELLDLAGEHAAWREIAARVADFDSNYLFSEARFADFRQELFEFFNRIRYKPKKSTFTPITLSASVGRRDIQVGLTGIYPEIKAIIADIENREKMLLINRVQFNSILAGQISAMIDLEAYFAK
jgi:hypothetical protein